MQKQLSNRILFVAFSLMITSAHAQSTTQQSACEVDLTSATCHQKAQVCGEKVGVIAGYDACNQKSSPPHPDFAFQKEVKFAHCMGHLPIITTLNDNDLHRIFTEAYKSKTELGYRTAGCLE